MIVTVLSSSPVQRWADETSHYLLSASEYPAGPPTWAVVDFPPGSSAGYFLPAGVGAVYWYFPNRVGNYVIQTISGGATVNTTLTVQATLPLVPSWDYDFTMDDKTLVSTSEDYYLMFRIKSGERKVWNLPFPDRTWDEFYVLRDFWRYHRKHKYFYYDEVGASDPDDPMPVTLVHFDSGIRVNPRGPNKMTMSCVIEEVVSG